MNNALLKLARDLELETPAQSRLRLEFSLACARRVRHLLEAQDVIALLDEGQAWLDRHGHEDELKPLAGQATQLARSHPGSKSIDGTAHAAVSASHAVARALAGRAIDAADYAAYAAVYAYAATAVNDPGAFAQEHAWQVETLARLAAAQPTRP